MNYPLLPFSSPPNSRYRPLNKITSSQEPIYHLTLKQVANLQQSYDDIKYQLKIIQKFIVICRIKQVSKGLSQRNIPLLKFKLTDNTKDWRQNKYLITYDVKMEQKLLYAQENSLYVEIGCNVKVTGLVYKTEIQVTAVSFRLITDFNKITEHFLACMKTNLITV